MSNKNKILQSKEWLYDQYINQKKSASKIANEIGCQQETVSRYLHKYNIALRSHSEEISGDRHPLFGKHHSEETRRKISDTNSCHITTIETRQKLSERMSGSGNPRFGAKLSEDQIARQKASLNKFYEEHPEYHKEQSNRMKEVHQNNPELINIIVKKSKQTLLEHPEIMINAAEKRKQFYIEHPLSDEEKLERANHLFEYFKNNPNARKDHSKLMKIQNPSSRPEVAEKISLGMKKWHLEHTLPIGTGKIPGRYYYKPNGNKLWMRSSYETRFASILDGLNIYCIYEPKAFELPISQSSYRPDFYIPKYDLYVEVKGYLSWSKKGKLIEFYNAYSNKNLIMIYLNQIEYLENESFCYTINDSDILKTGIKLSNQILLWKKEDIELKKLLVN